MTKGVNSHGLAILMDARGRIANNAVPLHHIEDLYKKDFPVMRLGFDDLDM